MREAANTPSMSLESDIAALLEIVPDEARPRIEEYQEQYEMNLTHLEKVKGDDADLEPIHLFFLEAIRDVLADYPNSRRMVTHRQ